MAEEEREEQAGRELVATSMVFPSIIILGRRLEREDEHVGRFDNVGISEFGSHAGAMHRNETTVHGGIYIRVDSTSNHACEFRFAVRLDTDKTTRFVRD